MNLTTIQLQKLIEELHEVNEVLADAVRPLKRLPDLDENQRQLVRARLPLDRRRLQSPDDIVRPGA